MANGEEMHFELLDSYESAILKISRRLVPANEVDLLGHCRDDYAVELMIESWQMQSNFRSRYGFRSLAERRYVLKSLWNKARSWERRRWVRVKKLREMKVDVPRLGLFVDGGRYEARESLAKLEDGLGNDFQILCRVGEAGSITNAYDESDGSFESFRWRIRRLRARAKQILFPEESDNGQGTET